MTPVDVGPFRLERVLGRGGMSEVWAGVHVRQKVPVAVKLPRADAVTDRELFAAEVRAVARLDHPGIILVFDHGVVDEEAEAASGGALKQGTPWLAMERCSGGSLRTARPATWPQLRRALSDVLGALAFAHARGVLHRDLNPDNVLIGAPGDLSPGQKLSDFGLAFAREADRPGVVIGTPAFMAPEQFARAWRDYGPWTDLYAFACLAWSLVGGAAPFGEGRPVEVLAVSHQELEPPPLRPTFEVPEGLEELLRTLLRKDPAGRPRHAADVLRALDGLAGARDDERFPADWRARAPARRPVRLWGVGLGLYAARPVPMVGRDSERDRLWAELGEVYRGGVARLVVVQGGLGLGKTRLVEWLSERAGEAGLATTLRVVPSEDDGPADSLRAALAARLGTEGLDGDALEDRIHGWLSRFGAVDAWEAKAVRALVHPGSADDSRSVAFLTPAQRYAVLRRLLERLAADRPLILWIEDAHLASDTLSFVDELLAAQDATPSSVLIVLTARVETLAERAVELAQVEELLARPGTVAIDLGPLAPPHQVQLVEGLLGLSGELAAQVRGRAGGNPAFAVQLVGDWVQRGVLVPTGDGFVLEPGAQAVIPDDLHTFWMARLERALDALEAPVAARQALELGALLGTDVDLAEWTAACACAGVVPPADLISRLVRERLLAQSEAGWTFAHTMVRESLVRSAVEAGRAPVWHAACAHALAMRGGGDGHAERLAGHLAGAGELDAAADFQLLAAQERLARGEDRAALGLLADRDDGLGAAEVPPSDARWGEGYTLQARLYAREGRWDDAAGPAEAGLAGARRHGWTALLPAALTVRGEVARGQGDPELALRYLSEARALCERAGDRRELAYVLRSLGTLFAQMGELGRATRLLANAQAAFRELRDNRAMAECLVARADVARRAGQPDRAGELAGEAAVLHARYGNRAGEADVHLVRADVARDRGNLVGAVELYRTSLTQHEAAGSGQVLAPLAGLGATLERQGRADDARNVLELALRLATRRGSRQWFGALHAQLLPVAAARADLAGFDEHLAEARRWLRETREVSPDVADAADRAVQRLDPRDADRRGPLTALAREQRAILARGMTEG